MCLLIYKQYDDGAYTQKKIITVTSKFKQSIYRLHWVDLLCEGREYSAYYTVFSTSKKTGKYHKTCSMYTNLHITE